jgi:ribosome-associated toxin RatA of RatAB toxin-antitoxin module
MSGKFSRECSSHPRVSLCRGQACDLYTSRYKRRQLYELVADVASYPHFVPFCTGSRILDSRQEKGQLEDPNTIMNVELKVGFLAFTESYVSTVTCTPCELVEVGVRSSIFWTVSMTLQKKGRSQFRYNLVQDARNSLAFPEGIVRLSPCDRVTPLIRRGRRRPHSRQSRPQV